MKASLLITNRLPGNYCTCCWVEEYTTVNSLLSAWRQAWVFCHWSCLSGW